MPTPSTEKQLLDAIAARQTLEAESIVLSHQLSSDHKTQREEALAKEISRAKEQEAQLGLKYRFSQLKGNPALFIPITALGEFAKNLDDGQKESLQTAIEALSPHYHYLGEFVFEDDKQTPELLDQPPEGFETIRRIMKANRLETGFIRNYNETSDLKAARVKSLDRKHGTGRRDLIRDFLLEKFGTKALGEGLKTLKPIELQTGKKGPSLVIAFNVPAQAKAYFDAKHEQKDPDLAAAIDYGVRRIITRSYLQNARIDRKTDEAFAEYNSPARSTKITVKDGAIKVTIPLDTEFHARMAAGRMDMDALQQSISREVALGIRSVQIAKHI